MEITVMNIIQILVFSSIAFILGYQTGWARSREKLPVVALTMNDKFKLEEVKDYEEGGSDHKSI